MARLGEGWSFAYDPNGDGGGWAQSSEESRYLWPHEAVRFIFGECLGCILEEPGAGKSWKSCLRCAVKLVRS